MAYRVIWTLRALRDLEESVEYLEKNSPIFASRFIKEVLHTAATLTISPHRGRYSRAAEKSETRELFIKQHRMIYRVIGDKVNIIRLVHMSRVRTD